MDAMLDTLAASRKLENSGMPGKQAESVVEVMSDAMQNLVTKEYLTAELDRRFGAVDKRFTEMKYGMDKRFSNIESGMDKRFSNIESGMDKRFSKIETDIDKRFSKIETDMDKRFSKIETDIDKRFSKIESDMDLRFGAVDTEFAKVREDAAKSHKSLVVIMMGSALAIIGMQLASLAIILSLLPNASPLPDAGASPEELGMPNDVDQTAV